MITIDVIGQLIPNPMTMLAQLCSTLVLFLFVKKFCPNSLRKVRPNIAIVSFIVLMSQRFIVAPYSVYVQYQV